MKIKTAQMIKEASGRNAEGNLVYGYLLTGEDGQKQVEVFRSAAEADEALKGVEVLDGFAQVKGARHD